MMPQAREAQLRLHVSQSLAVIEGIICGGKTCSNNKIREKKKNLNSFVFMITRRIPSVKTTLTVQMPG